MQKTRHELGSGPERYVPGCEAERADHPKVELVMYGTCTRLHFTLEIYLVSRVAWRGLIATIINLSNSMTSLKCASLSMP